MWIRFGGRSTAKSVALSKTACFGIATLLFLDFGQKQAQPSLQYAFSFSDLNLMACFTC
jgi:hypothetical protein